MKSQKNRKKKFKDIYSKKKRSEIMSLIKGKDTFLEIKFCKLLKDAKLRFSRNVNNLPGKPDILFRKKKIVVFIDGCFWHGCKIHFKSPRSNQWFWEEKIRKNMKRDRQINRFYKKAGWKVVRIWQHNIEKYPKKTVESLMKIIK